MYMYIVYALLYNNIHNYMYSCRFKITYNYIQIIPWQAYNYCISLHDNILSKLQYNFTVLDEEVC